MKKCNCKQKLSDKKITLSTNSGQELCVGDIVLYEAGTAYDGKWKVMTIDSWGRVLLMSTKNVAKVELSGYTGYLKCIEELNGVCEPLGRGYGAVGARCVNENDIIELTNGYKFYTKITSEMLFNKNRSASYWLANTSEITSEHVQSVTVSCICAGQKNYKTLYQESKYAEHSKESLETHSCGVRAIVYLNHGLKFEKIKNNEWGICKKSIKSISEGDEKQILNSVWCQDDEIITNGKTRLTIGDEVLYSALGTEYNGKWRVIGLNESGEVLIVADEDVAHISINGCKGCHIGYMLLNGNCEKYAHGIYASGARSINKSDVDKLILLGYLKKSTFYKDMIRSDTKNISYWLATPCVCAKNSVDVGYGLYAINNMKLQKSILFCPSTGEEYCCEHGLRPVVSLSTDANFIKESDGVWKLE